MPRAYKYLLLKKILVHHCDVRTGVMCIYWNRGGLETGDCVDIEVCEGLSK